jgi:hypothetical protein
VSARVGGGVDVIVSLGLLDAFDQRVFEGLGRSGGRDRPGGVMLLLAHVGNFD